MLHSVFNVTSFTVRCALGNYRNNRVYSLLLMFLLRGLNLNILRNRLNQTYFFFMIDDTSKTVFYKNE